jgi:hypothetical protein
VREIRTLRAMWRALETELRSPLNGHEEGNLGHKPRMDLRAPPPALYTTWVLWITTDEGQACVEAGRLNRLLVSYGSQERPDRIHDHYPPALLNPYCSYRRTWLLLQSQGLASVQPQEVSRSSELQLYLR